MELFVLRPPRFQELYNCSFYNVSKVPLEHRQHVPLGFSLMLLGGILEILYLPCMFSIWRHMEHACYKVMFYIGVLDMACLVVNSLASGWFAAVGAVYCMYPSTMYMMGAFANGFWCSETTGEIALAVNRCVEMSAPRLGRTLFGGRRTWLWVAVSLAYGIYVTWATPTVTYSGIYSAWFFNPHIGYQESNGSEYHNVVHMFHNWIVAVGIIGTYSTFAVIFAVKTYRIRRANRGTDGQPAQSSQRSSYSQKMIFLQVFIIGSVNALASSIYEYMQFNEVTEFMILLGHFMWFFAHGIPPVIYLAMNETIRRDCKRMVIKSMGGPVTSNQGPGTWSQTPYKSPFGKKPNRRRSSTEKKRSVGIGAGINRVWTTNDTDETTKTATAGSACVAFATPFAGVTPANRIAVTGQNQTDEIPDPTNGPYTGRMSSSSSGSAFVA